MPCGSSTLQELVRAVHNLNGAGLQRPRSTSFSLRTNHPWLCGYTRRSSTALANSESFSAAVVLDSFLKGPCHLVRIELVC
jgi:hypothetical protein